MSNNPGDVGRDQGMALVAANAGMWTIRAQQLLTAICERYAGHERTGEALANYIVEQIGSPHHHNALGSLCGWAVKKGYLVDSGKPRVKLQKPSSHSRKTPIYRFVQPSQAVPIRTSRS